MALSNKEKTITPLLVVIFIASLVSGSEKWLFRSRRILSWVIETFWSGIVLINIGGDNWGGILNASFAIDAIDRGESYSAFKITSKKPSSSGVPVIVPVKGSISRPFGNGDAE